mgnify:CR=1 FL=1
MRIIILKQEYNYMKKWIYSGTREEQPSERELMHGSLPESGVRRHCSAEK